MSHYDEIYDEFGAKRPAYACIESRTGVNVLKPPAGLIQQLSGQGVNSNGKLYAIPLVLDEVEYRNVLVPGILQRAFALQELFADLALGFGRLGECGLLNKGDLEHILLSEGLDHQTLRNLWRHRGPDDIRFVWGPDMVRDESGSWILLEDNIGCIGGISDGHHVLGRYLKAARIEPHPSLIQSPCLKKFTIAFLNRIGIAPHSRGLYGMPGAPPHCSGACGDREMSWKIETLRSLGIFAHDFEGFLDGIDSGSIQPTALVNLSSTLDPSFLRMMSHIFVNRKLPVFGAPGVGLVASKSFHALGDSLISFYLNQHSLLKTPSTELLRELPESLPEYGVLKRSNGCGGSEVFFLDELRNHSAREALIAELKRWGPCGAVIQEHVSRSVIAPVRGSLDQAAFVEIRPIVYIYGWRTAMVDNVLSGRAVPIGNKRFGNISKGALHLPVLREIVVPRNLSSDASNQHESGEQRQLKGTLK